MSTNSFYSFLSTLVVAFAFNTITAQAEQQTFPRMVSSWFKSEQVAVLEVEPLEVKELDNITTTPVLEPAVLTRTVELPSPSNSQDWTSVNNWLLSGLPTRTPDIDPSIDLEGAGVDRNEFLCMATNIYFEARGSTLNDQRAVAHVTLNRTKHHRWRGSVCDVVWERQQFSWTITAHQPRNRVKTARSWLTAQRIAYEVMSGEVSDITNQATNYYNPSVVNPPWARMAVRTTNIGAHRYMTLTSTENYNPPGAKDNSIIRRFARSISQIVRLGRGE